MVFSDSRQDAARLNAELDINHHRDTIRQLVVESLQRAQIHADAVRRAELFLQDPERYPQFEPAFREVLPVSEGIRALRAARDPFATEEERKRALDLVDREKAGRVPVTLARDSVFNRMLAVGRNPAGLYEPPRRAWYKLFEWGQTNVKPLNQGDMDIDTLRNRCMEEVSAALFAGTGRDVESLGLALVAPVEYPALPPTLDIECGKTVVAGAIRVLGCNRLYIGGRDGRDEYGNPPKALSAWLTAVGGLHGLPEGALVAWAKESLPLSNQLCPGWLVDPNLLMLDACGDALWLCPRCGWKHRHRSAGICMHCRAELGNDSDSALGSTDEDYYVTLAKRGAPIWRFSTAELTGQTERSEGASRQARFQGVFLDGEPERPNGIDVLSVKIAQHCFLVYFAVNVKR